MNREGPGTGASTALLLSLIPMVVLIVMVVRWAVDVPYLDEWEVVPLLQKSDAGTLTLHDIWAQHNEHRLLFPYLIILGLANLTSWNIRCEVFLNLALAIAIFAVMTLQIRATIKQTSIRALWFAVPMVSLLVFSFRQWQNWLWGSQIQMFLSVLAVVASIFLLGNSEFGQRRFAGAAALGVVASYSFANGLLIWPIGLLMILIAPAFAKVRWKYLGIWLSVGVLTMVVYMRGYVKPTEHPPLDFVLQYPRSYARYVLTYLGGAMSAHRDTATAFGEAGLVLAAFACWAAARMRAIRLQVLVPYLGIMAYAICTAMMTGLGRSGFGVIQAAESRYATVSCLMWCCIAVGLMMASAQRAAERGALLVRAVSIAALTLIVALSGLVSAFNVPVLKACHDVFVEARTQLRGIPEGRDPTGPAVWHLYPNPRLLTERTEFLAEKGLSMFRDD